MKTKEQNDNKKTAAEIIAQKFIDKLEAGTAPWVKPWQMWSSWSRATGNDYQGANILMLSGGEFATFKQIKEEGGRVNKGAKAEEVIHYTEYLRALKPEEAAEIRAKGMERLIVMDKKGRECIKSKSLKYYNVFSVTDTDLEQKHTGKYRGQAHKWDAHEKAEEIIEAYTTRAGINVHLGSNQAFEMGGQLVVLPRREQFENPAEYYSTMFHELTHSTAKAAGRDLTTYHKDKKARAREELIAEIGAAYILSFLGIESEFTEANSAAYLKSWAQNLKDDASAILYAAPKAIEAAEMILQGFKEEEAA